MKSWQQWNERYDYLRRVPGAKNQFYFIHMFTVILTYYNILIFRCSLYAATKTKLSQSELKTRTLVLTETKFFGQM